MAKNRDIKRAQDLHEERKEGRDVGDFRGPLDRDRHRQGGESLRHFLETYFPFRFALAWSPDHLKVIGILETTIRSGGLFALAMPRGSGKSTISECAALWALAYGYHSYVALIGATGKHAAEMLGSIKTELLTNDLLEEDFPALCGCVRELGDTANRAKGQHQHGRKTRIKWGADMIVLPHVTQEGVLIPAAEAVISVAPILGRVRGMKYTRGTGEVIRPTFVIPDDPQTDDSAFSPLQCHRRLGVLNGAILKLSGPGKKISAVCPCTVIAKGDMADKILDRKENPRWQGQRCKALYAFPERMDLWKQAAIIRADSLRADGHGDSAKEFIRANYEEMHRGAVVAWPERFDPGDVSALETLMNHYFEAPDKFWSEDQNEPQDEQAQLGDLKPELILDRSSGRERGVIPIWASKVTAYVDVQHSLLYWVVCAWKAEDFTGAVIDYGTWPEQHGRKYFTLADAQHTLQLVRPGVGLEAQLAGGINDLIVRLNDTTWRREDGTPMRLDRGMVDSSAEMDTVFEAVRPCAPRWTPGRGQGIGAKGKPMSEYTIGQGGINGFHWIEDTQANNKRALRWIRIDVNFWKSFVVGRLLQDQKSPGALTLFSGWRHDMFADHLCAERGVLVEANERKVVEWEQKPGKPDNHLFDCLVGAACAASREAVQAPGQAVAKPKERRTTSAADAAKKLAEFRRMRGF